MTMSSVGSHWRRFVHVCTSPIPNSTRPLHKSPLEWEHLSECISTLMRSCPAGRLAVLDHLTPLFGDYFCLWWQRGQEQAEMTTDGLDDLFAAEPVLRGIVQLTRDLVTCDSVSDEFISGVCLWVLARLRPACHTNPIKMLSSLRRLINSSGRANSSPPHTPRVPSTESRQVSRRSRRGGGGGSSRRGDRDRSPFGDSLNRISHPPPTASLAPPASNHIESSDSDSNKDSEDEDGVEAKPFKPASLILTPSTKIEAGSCLDMDATSAGNQMLLGPWSECSLLVDLLQLTYELLLGDQSRACSVQALVAMGTLLHSQSDSVDGAPSESLTAASTSPHWVLVWLLYQLTRQLDSVHTLSLDRFVGRLLQAAIHLPSIQSATTGDSKLITETLFGRLIDSRVDNHLWVASCLNHLIFLGDGVSQFISNWVSHELNDITSASHISSTKDGALRLASVCTPADFRGLVRVLLQLSTISAPLTHMETGHAATGESLHRLESRPHQPALRPPPVHESNMHSGNSMFVPGLLPLPAFGQLHPGQLVGPFGPRQPPPGNHPLPGPHFSFANSSAAGGFIGSPFAAPPAGPPLPIGPFPTSYGRVMPPTLRGSVVTESQQSSQRYPSTDQRPSASLLWLIELARRIRFVTMDAVVNSNLSRFSFSQIRNIIQLIYSPLQTENTAVEATVETQLLQLATEAILTAPAGSGCDQLLAFIIDCTQHAINGKSGSRPIAEPIALEDTLQWLGRLCAKLLQIICTTALCMVYAGTELEDAWARGGCEGLLLAAQSLHCSSPLARVSLLDELNRSELPFSVRLSIAQLIVLLSVTLESSLASESLFRLCGACSPEVTGVFDVGESDAVPLRLFFLLLDELECAMRARSTLTVRTTPLSQSSDLTTSVLQHEFLPRVWRCITAAAVSVASSRDAQQSPHQLLSSLQWLVRREQGLVHLHALRPRLMVTLRANLDCLFRLMYSTEDCELRMRLLTLVDWITRTPCTASIRPIASARTGGGGSSKGTHRPTTSASTRISVNLLSTRQAMTVARWAVKLTEKLLQKLHDPNMTSQVLAVVRVTHQARLLHVVTIRLASWHSLVRSVYLKHLPWIAMEPHNQSTTTTTTMTAARKASHANRSLDAHSLGSPFCLPIHSSDVLTDPTTTRTPFSGQLLLENPPWNVQSVSRGHLRPPPRGQHASLKRLDAQRFANTVSWQPTAFYWSHFAKCLIHMEGVSNVHSQCRGRRRLASSLQARLLPHGLHLPQTSPTHLPTPLMLVLPPSGCGLERVIDLLKHFCPEAKLTNHTNEPQRSIHSSSSQARLLHLWLDHVMETDLRAHGSDAMLTKSHDTGVCPPDSFALDSVALAEFQFPSPKLLIGLLLGLEAAWASPLAPRVPIADAIVYLSSDSGQRGQGLFPVLCSKGNEDLYTIQARRIATDYGQRRVDGCCSLFRFTKHILLFLTKLCYSQDVATVSKFINIDQTPSSSSIPDIKQAPLDRFLYCLSPRELSVLLSDVRRNLRLRMAFSFLARLKRLGGMVDGKLSESMSKLLESDQLLPPSPALVSAGLLMALLQSHLVEPGVDELVGPLVRLFTFVHTIPTEAKRAMATATEDAFMEEVDMDGELVMVLNK